MLLGVCCDVSVLCVGVWCVLMCCILMCVMLCVLCDSVYFE